ncbi:MAG: heat shock protein HslVU, ATPase subunit HslU [Candidatus Aminicenantes bacterium]|nr:heat shock protein HslVU, ATPase subunit HslU [Candidatus Aminicenantes bacterium]
MPIVLPESLERPAAEVPQVELTPREIVAELDKYIIGQKAAKKAVAIALRNRYRRRRLPPDLADEIAPKNILMIGPTGVGKTEISRRLAKLTSSPFLKIEASKFTEVGYVGRDVESMIRDLVRISVDMVKQEKVAEIVEKARAAVEEKLLDILLPPAPKKRDDAAAGEEEETSFRDTREKLRTQLRSGALDERTVEIEVKEKTTPPVEVVSNAGIEEIGFQIQDLLPGSRRPARSSSRRRRSASSTWTRSRAWPWNGSSSRVSSSWTRSTRSPAASPATTVNTRFGLVRTDHILFIGAGAFHVSKPSDLIPELQGRFPIRVELTPLTRDDFVRILTEPENALIRQYEALLGTEGVHVAFTPDAVDEIADIAEKVNADAENIGARRLHTVVEKVMEDISFAAPDVAEKSLRIDRNYVHDHLKDILVSQDLRRFIL